MSTRSPPKESEWIMDYLFNESSVAYAADQLRSGMFLSSSAEASRYGDRRVTGVCGLHPVWDRFWFLRLVERDASFRVRVVESDGYEHVECVVARSLESVLARAWVEWQEAESISLV